MIHVSIDGAIAVFQLNAPPRNGVTFDLLEQLAKECTAIAANDSVRAVVIWGGDTHFSGGSDLRQMHQLSVAEAVSRSRRGQAGVAAISRLNKPVAAAIAGLAIGGGLELALCADYRIATRSAKLGFPEVTNGRMPGAGGTQILPRLIGESYALDLICSGRLVTADEAKSIGLVNDVVAEDALLSAAIDWAARFTSLSPLAVSTARRAVRAALETSLIDGLILESDLYGELYASDSSLSQLAAFHNDQNKVSDRQ
jgi:enoyl-CoA hydratase/carnithine racemase